MSKKDLTAACQDQRVATSGTNMCRAMELTAVGAVPEGAPPDVKVRAARRVPELFQPEVRLEVEDLMKACDKSVLKTVCERRGMHNSCTKIGLAVCIVLNKSRQ